MIDTNFAVGSIFGIWEGPGFIDKTGRDQVASVVAVYGPRCTLAVSVKNGKSINGVGHCIVMTLHKSTWVVTNPTIDIAKSGKVYAPGNLRATMDNKKYQDLVSFWLEKQYTLR